MNDIAVIGLGCRFPQSSSIDDFWFNLQQGKNLISYFTIDELINAGIDRELVNHPQYVRAKGLLPDIDKFDLDFFKWSKMDADSTDPQHRVFLETVWTALNNAGYCEEKKHERFGVFASCNTMNSYLYTHLYSNAELVNQLGGYYLALNNAPEFLPTRVAYTFNFTGPAVFVHSACSSGLTVIQQACQSLLDFSCDMAIAGAINWRTPHKTGYLYQEGMILSPDGVCRPFDRNARGTVPSDGVGVVLLKRLSDALKDNDLIYAVIKSVAINNDGGKKMGFSAPSTQGQAQVIADALAIAEIEAEDVGYIETHGTATSLGDPIEFAALQQFYGHNSQTPTFLGSVKSNLGHLDVAAGMAGFIKTVLSLHHHNIPQTLNFSSFNSNIDFNQSALTVNTESVEWGASNKTLYAAVSAFGIGGTNVHLILQQHLSERKKENPSYPFQKTQCWIEKQTPTMTSNVIKPSINDWYTAPCWALNPLNDGTDNDAQEKKACVVVVAASMDMIERILPQLRCHYLQIVIVVHGSHFIQHNETEFNLNLFLQEDSAQLAEKLNDQKIIPSDILYLPLLLPQTQEWVSACGYQTVLAFFVRIQHYFSRPCNFFIVTSELYPLTNSHVINPQHFTIEGFSNVVSQEHPTWHCKTINFIEPMAQDWPKLVMQELTQVSPDVKICYQSLLRYTQEYRSLSLIKSSESNTIKPEGVYYITGGLGGMGLVVAEFLAQNANCHLILLGRTGVQSVHQSEAIKRIEALGATVYVESLDITDFAALEQSITALKARGLIINGVIHAAGNIDPHSMYPMSEMSDDKFALHFDPKVKGLKHLMKALQSYELDFFVCMSSLSTILGGLKYSCYSAANNYLNAIAATHYRQSKTHWLSLNWDGWLYDNQQGSAHYEALKHILITAREGQKVLADLFAFASGPIINISVRNFYERYAAWKQAALGLYATDGRKRSEQFTFSGIYADIKTQWQHSLGLVDVHEDSDFYLLGGDSLLAISMSHNISEAYEIQFLPNHFLVNPTIYKQAQFIANLLGVES